MNTATITPTDVLDEVVRIGATMPDVVYDKSAMEGCLYNPTAENPHGCIIGFALRNLGIEVGEQWEGEGAADVITGILYGSEAVRIDLDGELADPVLLRLNRIQTRQDGGASWGTAVSI
jgi:hypothetical protein